jgi:spore coat-associated protein N
VARIAFIIKQPKRTLCALAVLVAATGVVVGSGANFTASSANPDNEFSTGALSIENSLPAAAILTASGMKPGGTATTGTVNIRNTGTLPETFSLSRSAPVDSDSSNPLSAKLNLVVKDCGAWTNPTTQGTGICEAGDPTVYSGTIAGMSGAQALSTFAANEKHTYEFTVQLDASATDAYQNDTSETIFTWSAVQ